MDFELTDEQRQLQDSVARFVQDNYSFEQRRAIVATDAGFSEDHWKQMAELGWLGLALPEDHGGIGLGPVETMILMEEFGKGLVAEPYLATVVLGAGAVVHGGSDAQKNALLPAVAEGKLKLALGFAERQSRYNLADVATTAKPLRDGTFTLNGMKGVVFGAPAADKIIVSARTSGGPRDADGISLFIVDKGQAGVTVRGYPTADGLRAGEVTLENVEVGQDAMIGGMGEGLPVLEKVIDYAIAAIAAEATGAMSHLNDMTLEYIKTREQFGQPIGKFQVLQHRMVDMFIAHEEAKSMAMMAAMRVEEDDSAERKKAMSAAKVQIGKSGRYVGQQAIQLHGGIGMTDEYAAGHYFKRLTMVDRTFGDVDFHLKRFSDLS
ncbi:MAG: acyl-CoA dehydrogenase family protein [Alphaproteobacteria bacterium]|nr:acyl-CoA dehydrogenase family protein [Alphaproteobacteria bacterium]